MSTPTYRIEVLSGSLNGGTLAGTHATLYLTLYGTKASTDELMLAPHVAREHTGIDSFSFPLGELGEIRRLHVRHDNAGISPALFLDRITVRNVDSEHVWTFPCNRWLARHQDDGEIERTLDAT